MRILLTNDDGIHAAGLKLLELIAGELSDDVTVVARKTTSRASPIRYPSATRFACEKSGPAISP